MYSTVRHVVTLKCYLYSYENWKFIYYMAINSWEEVFKLLIEHHELIRNLGLVSIASIGFPFLIWRTIIASATAKTGQANHISEMFNKSIEQLGANNSGIPSLERRIGAIFVLEKTANNNADYYPQVMEILCSYIRLNSPVNNENRVKISEDIQTAITVIGRCLPKSNHNPRRLNLSYTNLNGAIMYGANLVNAQLIGVDLYNCDLEMADLRKANLENANLMNVKAYKADFERANLQSTNLTLSDFDGANFEGSNLKNAAFKGTTISKANFNRTIYSTEKPEL